MNKTLVNKYNSRVIMYNNILIEVGFNGSLLQHVLTESKFFFICSEKY